MSEPSRSSWRRSRLIRAGVATAVLAAAVRVARPLRGRGEPLPGRLLHLGDGDVVHADWHKGVSGPSVVFENALLSAMTQWLWVRRHLDASVPVLAYDRPATGWTPRARGSAGSGEHARRLRRLLAAVAAPPPYVLVGHSVGGILIRSFAVRHPELVAGLVFVDASHPDQFDRSRAQRDSLPAFRQNLVLGGVRSFWGGMYGPMAASDVVRLPGLAAEQTRRRLSRPGPWFGAVAELDHCLAGWNAQARRLTSFEGKPVAVVTAGLTASADPEHGRLQQELAGLSGVHRHEVVQGAGHESLVMDPSHAKTVAEAIDWVRERSAVLADTGRNPVSGKEGQR